MNSTIVICHNLKTIINYFQIYINQLKVMENNNDIIYIGIVI